MVGKRGILLETGISSPGNVSVGLVLSPSSRVHSCKVIFVRSKMSKVFKKYLLLSLKNNEMYVIQQYEVVVIFPSSISYENLSSYVCALQIFFAHKSFFITVGFLKILMKLTYNKCM